MTPPWIGFFNSHPRRRYIDARLTLDGIDYNAIMRLDKVHKAQRHLVQIGAWFRITKRGVIVIQRLPKLTKKGAAKITAEAAEWTKLFEDIV